MAFTNQISQDAVNAAVQLVARVVETKDFSGVQAQQGAEDGKMQAQVQMESTKTDNQIRLEREKHQMALEAAQQNAQIAAQSAPAPSEPAPPPVIEVAPPDMSEIGKALEGITQVLMVLANKESTPVIMHHETAAAQPPVVNVHPASPAQVHVAAPNISVPAPVVNVHGEKKGKRKGKMTGPDGREFTIETTSEE